MRKVVAILSALFVLTFSQFALAQSDFAPFKITLNYHDASNSPRIIEFGLHPILEKADKAS